MRPDYGNMAATAYRKVIDGGAGTLMKFLVHAQVNEANIGEQLGVADYSYFFLLRSFSQVLAELGEVVVLQDPAEADALHAQSQEAGESCLLLSFAPPHKTPLGLACPVVPVFAWEYPDIPEQLEEACWQDDPRNDWRHVFSHTGKAIALSRHTVDAVKRVMGSHFPIAAIPPPFPSVTEQGQPGESIGSIAQGAVLRIEAAVADSRRMGLNVDQLLSLDVEDGTPHTPRDEEWLPPLGNPVDPSEALPLESAAATVELLPGESEPGICDWNLPPRMPVAIGLQGVVYTSVLTPTADNKNWEDLISAFCWTFRDREDVTLILKLSGDELLWPHHKLLMLLSKLSPMRCQVISIYGYLSDAHYLALIEATTFYVNASLCEGICLPLLEFLHQGVPAIAPRHTAMADYVDEKLAFVVESCPGYPTSWPHGDRKTNRTTHHQIQWASLADAYRQSYRVARQDPVCYRDMSIQARDGIQAYANPAAVSRMLEAFLCSNA